MDLNNFVGLIEKSKLPFLYSGSKLNDEKCQNLVKKINAEGTVLGVITDNSLKSFNGLVVTEKGIWFDILRGEIVEKNETKSKCVFLFDSYLLNSVTVKNSISNIFTINFILYDLKKAKGFTFKFNLIEDNFEIQESVNNELEEVFKTLISKTGTEYVPVKDKDPNIFDFIWDSFHTNIVLNNENVVISKLRIDEITSIQKLIDTPVTISRFVIASVTKGRNFSPLTLFKDIGKGIGFFIAVLIFSIAIYKILEYFFEIGDTIFYVGFWIGLIGLILLTLIGIFSSFPRTLVVNRKDGKKIVSRLNSNEENTVEYERFINTIFKQ